MNNFSLFPVLLAAFFAIPPASNAQGYFDRNSSSRAPSRTSNNYIPVEYSWELKQAAERVFGRRPGRRDPKVPVADRLMGMNIVEYKGYTFAVLKELGIPFSLKGQPNLSAEVQIAVQTNSGCAITGNTWTKRFSNGAYPIYVVHIICP